jgi:hypothetical protein
MNQSAMEFVVAGHSHLFAMGASLGYAGDIALTPIDGVGGRGYFLMERWKGGRSPAYWEALVKHSRGRAVVLVYRGNQHFLGFLLARTPLFDFVDPMDRGHALYPGAVVVPRRMVKASPVLSLGGLRDTIRRLLAAGCRSVILTGTPPVRENFGDYMYRVRQVALWRETAKKIGVDIEMCDCTPAPIMKRLWGVVQESLADVARETGARFLPVAKEAVDGNGYLAAQYCGPLTNFTHANDAYGRLMLDHVYHAVNEAGAKSVAAPVRLGADVALQVE